MDFLQELVWILHKALEASQLEKRTCAEFLAEEDEQQRLELLRHRERQAADLRTRLEEARMEAETLRRKLADRDAQVAELQENIRLLTEKNAAKQQVRRIPPHLQPKVGVVTSSGALIALPVTYQVIVKLSDQVTSILSDPRHSDSSGTDPNTQTQKQLQQQIENFKVKSRSRTGVLTW